MTSLGVCQSSLGCWLTRFSVDCIMKPSFAPWEKSVKSLILSVHPMRHGQGLHERMSDSLGTWLCLPGGTPADRAGVAAPCWRCGCCGAASAARAAAAGRDRLHAHGRREDASEAKWPHALLFTSDGCRASAAAGWTTAEHSRAGRALQLQC